MSTPVRSVNPRSHGSGRRPSETIHWPDLLWWAYWAGVWSADHPRTAGTVWLALFAWAESGSWMVGCIVAALLWVVAVCLWMVGSRASVGPRTCKTLVIGSAHIVTLRKAWPAMCEAARIQVHSDGRPPRLRRVVVLPGGGVRAFVRLGSDVEKIESCSTLAHAVGCREVDVSSPTSGWAKIELFWGDALLKTVHLQDLPRAAADRLTYGITADKRPATVSYAQSILVGGVTRSGKSTFIWDLIADLRRQHIPTRLYVSDAKGGIELRELGQVEGRDTGCVRVHRYAATPGESEALVGDFLTAMNSRRGEMRQRGDRKHVPTEDDPLAVLIVDELLPLLKQLKGGVHSELGQVLYMGAAVGYVVWAGTQDATKESVGPVRDLFPQRVAFAVRSREMAEVILGSDAVAGGAKAHKLRTPGMGYSETEGEWGFRRFRAAHVSDVEALQIANGTLPGLERPVDEGRTALYRWWGTGPESEPAGTRDVERGLYVGVSFDALNRFRQHQAAGKDWTRRVTRSTVEYFPSRKDALAAEAAEIDSGFWSENIAGAGKRRRRPRAVAVVPDQPDLVKRAG